MTTKVTLTIDESIVSSAKKYAKQNGKSLSKIVEDYLRSIISTDEEGDDISSRIRKLLGSISLPENREYKAFLGKSILQRYK